MSHSLDYSRDPHTYRPSEKLLQRLRKDGWYPGRLVDDAIIRENCLPIIRKIGCRIFPAAIRILKEYGGLSIGQDSPLEPSREYRNPLIIWPYEYVRDIPLDLFQMEWRLNQILFPIAHLQEKEIDLFVNPQGEIYGYINISGDIYFFGNCFEAALDNMTGQMNGQERELELELPRWTETNKEAAKYFSWMKI